MSSTIHTYLLSFKRFVFKLTFDSLQDLGYKNDVGYQSFLYHNETELRQVFMFLIEQLPSERTQSAVPSLPDTNKSSLLRIIAMKIDEELNTIWIPQCCISNNQGTIGKQFFSE